MSRGAGLHGVCAYRGAGARRPFSSLHACNTHSMPAIHAPHTHTCTPFAQSCPPGMSTSGTWRCAAHGRRCTRCRRTSRWDTVLRYRSAAWDTPAYWVTKEKEWMLGRLLLPCSLPRPPAPPLRPRAHASALSPCPLPPPAAPAGAAGDGRARQGGSAARANCELPGLAGQPRPAV